MPNLRQFDRAASSSLSLTGPSLSLPQIYTTEKLTQSLIYKPIPSPSPPSEPPTDLAIVRPTRRSRRCQTHSSPSDPPTNIWSFTSLSLNLSLPLPLSRSMLIFKEDCIFFWLIWFIYSDFLLQYQSRVSVFFGVLVEDEHRSCFFFLSDECYSKFLIIF